MRNWLVIKRKHAMGISLRFISSAERERVLKAKAARLEIKRQMQAERAKEVEAEKAAHAEFVAKRFEEKKILREQKAAEIEAKRLVMLEQLKEQSKTWIRAESVEDQLAEAAFVTKRKETSENKVGNLGALSWLERLKSMKPVENNDDKERK